ncbi:MAG: hypothetical protein Q7S60_01870 [bacterium]|nr:hypothetical protein [bacterium]
MIELPHTIVGAALAAKIGNPALALPLALASHFVLDMLPHWNPHLRTEKRTLGDIRPKTKRIVMIDVVVSIVVGVAIATTVLPDTKHFIVVLLGAFLAVLPDVLEGPYFFFNQRNKVVSRLLDFQKSLQFDVSFLPGVLTQIILSFAALWWIFNP